MFVYRLHLSKSQTPNDIYIERNRSPNSGGGTRGVSVDQSTPARLQENASFVVKRMGYCREDFLVIDSSASRYNLWVKGECKEDATDEDRKRFGTKQTLMVSPNGD